MRCDLKEPGAGTQALGGEGNRAESWYRNWSWCISALPLRERGTRSCIQGLHGVPAHWKCHHSSTTDLHEIREWVRPDCRGREAQLLNAYIKVFRLVSSRCRCGCESKRSFKCPWGLCITKEWSLIVLKTHQLNHFIRFLFQLKTKIFSRLFPWHPQPLTQQPCPWAERTLIVHFQGAFISLAFAGWSSQQ